MQKVNTRAQELIIRPEKAKDLPGIRSLLLASFTEQSDADLVERLRVSHSYIAPLTLIAERDGRIEGFAMCSTVQLGEQASPGTLALGPVAVHPSTQRQGIGSQLITEMIKLADERGDSLIVVLGNDQYYKRFGFIPSDELGITPPRPWPRENFMVKTLSAFDTTRRGTISYPAEWRI